MYLHLIMRCIYTALVSCIFFVFAWIRINYFSESQKIAFGLVWPAKAHDIFELGIKPQSDATTTFKTRN